MTPRSDVAGAKTAAGVKPAAVLSVRRPPALFLSRFRTCVRLADLGADSIAAYHRHLERGDGRAGGPVCLATRRVQMAMLRALARQLALPDVAATVRVPSDRVGPPETLDAQE